MYRYCATAVDVEQTVVVMASGIILIGAKTYWEVEQQSSKEDGFQQNQT